MGSGSQGPGWDGSVRRSETGRAGSGCQEWIGMDRFRVVRNELGRVRHDGGSRVGRELGWVGLSGEGRAGENGYWIGRARQGCWV